MRTVNCANRHLDFHRHKSIRSIGSPSFCLGPWLSRSAWPTHRSPSQPDYAPDSKTVVAGRLTLCNPPFHASLADARAGSARKWQNLGKTAGGDGKPALNFGGRLGELCCPGGEAGFVGRMIAESPRFAGNCLWLSSLVSKAANLPVLESALKQAGVHEHRVIAMAQGQKRSRIVAWTFLDCGQRRRFLTG